MKRLRLYLTGLTAALAFLALFAWQSDTAVAQSGSRRGGVVPYQGSGVQPGSSMRAQPETFESKFWNWLTRAQYRNWAPIPGKPGEAYVGESPHGAMVKLFANRTAAANPDTLPNGSVIIKENYGPDGKTLMAVTVMYKNEGYNAAGGDWYWAKYDPSGKVAVKDGMRIAGRFKSCIECHSSADGGDYLFANDK